MRAGRGQAAGDDFVRGQEAEHIELLELEQSGIHVATFWTKLLPKRVLERKLHEAVRLARARLARRTEAAANSKADQLK